MSRASRFGHDTSFVVVTVPRVAERYPKGREQFKSQRMALRTRPGVRNAARYREAGPLSVRTPQRFRRRYHDAGFVPRATNGTRVARSLKHHPSRQRPSREVRELAERVGFEPTCRLPDKTLSRRPRYDHFGTSPLRTIARSGTRNYSSDESPWGLGPGPWSVLGP